MNTARKIACTGNEPAICGVCRRSAVAVGYTPKNPVSIMWLCDSADCHKAAKKVYYMPQATLDKHETEALWCAGSVAGEYIDNLGKTDLAELDHKEWKEFLRRVVVGYTDAMRAGLKQ